MLAGPIIAAFDLQFVMISECAEGMARKIRLPGGRRVTVSPVFDAYWRFASKRQDLFMHRVTGQPFPWTDDPILANYRFTNVYRAADRVSQYLIRNVLYQGDQNAEEVFFRALLFKVFNRIETWQAITGELGQPRWRDFDLKAYARVLDQQAQCHALYSAAYIMPCPGFGNASKHRNHLRLIECMMRDQAPNRVQGARSLRDVFGILRGYSSIGDFLAYQFAIDLNYSELINFSEMDFVVAGPGARDGISKCFQDKAGLADPDLIQAVADLATSEFQRAGLRFQTLWGRELQLIDFQNLFCEVDKYSRVLHPSIQGRSRRSKIKQRFRPNPLPLPQWYPPKWGLKLPEAINAEQADEVQFSRALVRQFSLY